MIKGRPGPAWDPDDLRQRAEARVAAREEFRIHAVVYLLVNALLIAVWAFNRADIANPWPLYSILGWGIGLFAHWYSTYGRDETHREAEIDREMARLRRGGGPVS